MVYLFVARDHIDSGSGSVLLTPHVNYRDLVVSRPRHVQFPVLCAPEWSGGTRLYRVRIWLRIRVRLHTEMDFKTIT